MKYIQFAMLSLILKHGYKTALVIAFVSIGSAFTYSYWWLSLLPAALCVAFIKSIMKDVIWG